jgi:tungstate transport system permease protein
MMLTIIREARGGIWSGVAAAFGRAISEVGAVMLVGGNIEHHTRVMTTAIILETRTGNFSAGLQLGLVLLAISFLFNSFLMVGMMNQMKMGRR